MQRASAVEPAGVVEVPPEVAEGSLLQRVEPEYPEEARQRRCKGQWFWRCASAAMAQFRT